MRAVVEMWTKGRSWLLCCCELLDLHAAKDEWQKLDPKARKCIFLGYSMEIKGYQLYNPKRGKVFYSQNVLLNESNHGFDEPSEHEKERYIQLDYISNEGGVADEPAELVLRQSEREQRPPSCYGKWVSTLNVESNEPLTAKEALASPEKAKLMKAMEKEMESLHTNDVWDLAELPNDQNAVGSKWVFKLKICADGLVE